MNERMARVFSGCDSQMKHEEHRIPLKRFGEEREEGTGTVLHHAEPDFTKCDMFLGQHFC